MGHQVQAEGGEAFAAQRLVGVDREPLVAVGAQARGDFGGIRGLGLLADHVDAAAGGARAAEDRVGPLDDFHRVEVEEVAAAGLRAVAQAVHLHVRVGAETTDVDRVAGTAAAFARVEGDARDIGQGLPQAERVLFVQHLARHHGDGLRHVQQRHGVLGRSGNVGLGTRDRLPADRDRRQLHARAVGGALGIGRRGQGGGGCGREGGIETGAGRQGAGADVRRGHDEILLIGMVPILLKINQAWRCNRISPIR